MCAALLSPNCRDAFLRLSQLPSLRDWRFYSAILLAETQECVSTTFRRTHVNIKSSEKSKRSPELTAKLLSVWEASVRASHHFLTKTDITRLAPQAEEALRQIETLWIVEDGQHPVGFMGVQERKIEMLFLHPDYFRKGLGKELARRAFDELGVEFVDVNEQNPAARMFYERMGFKVFKRDETDSEGNPFPILEMKRTRKPCRK